MYTYSNELQVIVKFGVWFEIEIHFHATRLGNADNQTNIAKCVTLLFVWMELYLIPARCCRKLLYWQFIKEFNSPGLVTLWDQELFVTVIVKI